MPMKFTKKDNKQYGNDLLDFLINHFSEFCSSNNDLAFYPKEEQDNAKTNHQIG